MKKKTLLFLLFIYSSLHLFSQSISKFQNGDRIAFLGNSITDGGHYHSFIWLYYMTRYPNMNVQIMNAGIGGNTVHDMYKRFDDDVLSKRPTSIIITFGMNDSGYFEYNSDKGKAFGEEKYTECYNNFKMLEKHLTQIPGTKIIMMGSSPYDETAIIKDNSPFKGKNAVMQRIVQFQKSAALKNKWQFLDLNEPITTLNSTFQQQNPSFTLCGNDRIHPDNDGHMVMAYFFLKQQGFTGNKVADVEINTSKNLIAKSENCEISNLKRIGSNLSFDYLAQALPYPLDTIARGWNAKKTQADAVKYIPFMEDMNQENLKITGLNGTYKLFIDTVQIGTWSSNDLAKGINLAAESKTPQYQQALAIMHLNENRWEIERNFRDYAWVQFGFFQDKGLLFANNRASIDALDKEVNNNAWLKIHRDLYTKMMHQPFRDVREKEMNLFISKIYETNKPVKHTINLEKIL